MERKKYPEPALVSIDGQKLEQLSFTSDTVTRSDSVKDLSRLFDAGTISVDKFMSEMTTGNHEQAERYNALKEAEERGYIEGTYLVKNESGIYEFKGKLTNKGLARVKELETGPPKRRLPTIGVPGASYGQRTAQSEMLGELEKKQPPSSTVGRVEEPKAKEETISNVDSVIMDRNSTISGWGIIGNRFSGKIFEVNETPFSSSEGSSFSLKELNLLRGKIHSGDRTL